MPSLTRRGGLCAALSVCALAGCGGDDEGTPALSSATPGGEGGTLVWAVADPVNATDPLEAATRAEEIVTRQVNEPLTARLSGPFDTQQRRTPGLVVDTQSSAGDTIWTLSLRDGVLFQDGEPLNAAAVQANATRWMTTAAGRTLLPDLVSVDAPSPGQVRFALSAPDSTFPKRLANPRLGIVSPSALQPATGEGAIVRRPRQTGTGAFEVRERDGSHVLLARNTAWWGTSARVDLGPALEQVELEVTPSPSLRLAMLDAGEAQLADELDAQQAVQARNDPLLSVLSSPGGTFLGIERSVRGIDSGREIPALSSAWLTGLNVAD